MIRWTIDDIMARGPCLNHYSVSILMGSKRTVTPRDVAFAEHVSLRNRIWLLAHMHTANKRAGCALWDQLADWRDEARMASLSAILVLRGQIVGLLMALEENDD